MYQCIKVLSERGGEGEREDSIPKNFLVEMIQSKGKGVMQISCRIGFKRQF